MTGIETEPVRVSRGVRWHGGRVDDDGGGDTMVAS